MLLEVGMPTLFILGFLLGKYGLAHKPIFILAYPNESEDMKSL